MYFSYATGATPSVTDTKRFILKGTIVTYNIVSFAGWKSKPIPDIDVFIKFRLQATGANASATAKACIAKGHWDELNVGHPFWPLLLTS